MRLYNNIIRNEITTLLVCCLKITRKGGYRLLVFVDYDIADKGQICHSCSCQHVLMNGILIKNTGSGIGAVYKFRTVISHDCNRICNSRKDRLASAGKSGKEMCLDKAFCYQQRGFKSYLIKDTVRTGRKDTYRGIFGWIMGIVDNYIILKFQVKIFPKLSP
jgi:hypothetical protein